MARTEAHEARTRAWLAIGIVSLSIAGIAVASTVAIYYAAGDSRTEMARLVFASVLPLFGTWIGTVLAFYFARENLQAATESSLRLAGRVDPGTPVAEVMIPLGRIVPWRLQPGADPRSVTLVELYNRMESAKVGRLPILDDADAVLYVVHRSTITAFADAVAKDPGTLTETMADLLGRADLKKAVEAIGFVRPDAVVAEARAAMRSVQGCNDVFVTVHGKPQDPVVGWLTNTDLAGVT